MPDMRRIAEPFFDLAFQDVVRAISGENQNLLACGHLFDHLIKINFCFARAGDAVNQMNAEAIRQPVNAVSDMLLSRGQGKIAPIQPLRA